MYLSLIFFLIFRMDLEGGVNYTNLLNVFLEIVNPLNFEEFNPSRLKPFTPHKVVEGGGGGGGGVRAPPTNS